jgi:hypothetical protein
MASVGILSIMEPLLGVINACLPLLRPVVLELQELLGLEKATQSKPQNYHSPFPKSIGSRRTRMQIKDPYPLDTTGTIHDRADDESKIQSADDEESVKQLVYCGAPQSVGDHRCPQITVRSDREVDYNRA